MSRFYLTPDLFRRFVETPGPEQVFWCLALFFRAGDYDIEPQWIDRGR